MADDLMKLIIRTPEKSVYEGDVKSILVNTDDGVIQILPNHQNLLSSLTYSETVIELEGKDEKLILQRGVISVLNEKNTVLIMCLRAEKYEEVDYVSVEKYIEVLNAKLEDKDSLSDFSFKFIEDEKFAMVKLIEEKDES